MDKEGNRMVIERIAFHLIEALRFCSQLDLSDLSSSDQDKVKFCKNALEFSKDSMEELRELFA